MDANFWHSKWAANEIGFHKHEANPLLVKHLSALPLATGARVFVPLCGKTLDIKWLRANGFRVVGAELSQLAVNDLFADLGVTPSLSNAGPLKRHSAEGIDIFVGDIFDLAKATLGTVDAVYDRAALVALPEGMRKRYAAHLVALSSAAPQLLISYAYDQSEMAGPPFSVPDTEVERHYAAHYTLTRLAHGPVPGGLRNATSATQSIWYLS